MRTLIIWLALMLAIFRGEWAIATILGMAYFWSLCT